MVLLVVLLAAIPLARWEYPDDLIAAGNDQPLAIDNVHLVTMSGGGVLRDRQLLIRNGVIVAIHAAGAAVSGDYRLLDGNSAYLLPGLFDMHVHVMDRKYLALSLAHGVTSVRNMGGYPMHLRWRQELVEGRWLGSNLFTATPTLNGKKNSNPFAHKVVTSAEAARDKVRRYQSQGWDFIKVYTRLAPDVYAAIVDEADKLGFPAAGHVPYPVVELDYGLAEPLVTIEHTEELFQGPLGYDDDPDAVLAIADALKAMNATVTPTLMIFDHLTLIARDKNDYVKSLPLEYLNPLMRFVEDRTSGARWLQAGKGLQDSLEQRNALFKTITRVLHERQVNLVLGSDGGAIYTVPGPATHDEIALMQQSGLSNDAILQMATISAARVLGVEDELGSIEVGKTADLVMAADNPLDEIGGLRDPIAVIKGGQFLDRDALERLRESARNPSGYYTTFGRLLEFMLLAN